MPNPILETRVLKLVFITIPCLKFWALATHSFSCTTISFFVLYLIDIIFP